MKKRISIIAVLIAAAALAVAPLVLARPSHGGGPGLHGFGILGHLKHAKEELDLSDQQVDQIKAIFSETHEQNAPYREQLHGGFKEIGRTLIADPNNVTAAQALLDQQAAAERAMKANLLQATARALAVLDAEQRAKLGTMLDELAARRGRRGRR